MFFGTPFDNYINIYESTDGAKDGVYFQYRTTKDGYPEEFQLNMRSNSTTLFTGLVFPDPLPAFENFDNSQELYLTYYNGNTYNAPWVELTSYITDCG